MNLIKVRSLGMVFTFQMEEPHILNFPTKDHWRYPSKLEWIEEGLKYFADKYKSLNIKSIAFPKLGTDKGGLEWEDVKDLMEKYLGNIDILVYVCYDNKPDLIEQKMIQEVNTLSYSPKLRKMLEKTKLKNM
ncbi:hypothetical protein DRP05_10440 [Archaeoglobales archaeon]|nr:MAG: hypothetical protein DRP05_10440 [Archaeoglobales archaeon]